MYNPYRTQQDPAKYFGEVGTGLHQYETRYKETGLQSLTRYWFAVCALGAAGPSALSDHAIGVAA